MSTTRLTTVLGRDPISKLVNDVIAVNGEVCEHTTAENGYEDVENNDYEVSMRYNTTLNLFHIFSKTIHVMMRKYLLNQIFQLDIIKSRIIAKDPISSDPDIDALIGSIDKIFPKHLIHDKEQIKEEINILETDIDHIKIVQIHQIFCTLKFERKMENGISIVKVIPKFSYSKYKIFLPNAVITRRNNYTTLLELISDDGDITKHMNELSVEDTGCGPCYSTKCQIHVNKPKGPCLVRTTIVTSPWDGKPRRITKQLNCKTPNLVYYLKCTKCPMGLGLTPHYVGSCKNIKERWSKHKNDMKKGKGKDCGFCKHWATYHKHDLEDFSSVEIYFLDKTSETELEILEEDWMIKMGSLAAVDHVQGCNVYATHFQPIDIKPLASSYSGQTSIQQRQNNRMNFKQIRKWINDKCSAEE